LSLEWAFVIAEM